MKRISEINQPRIFQKHIFQIFRNQISPEIKKSRFIKKSIRPEFSKNPKLSKSSKHQKSISPKLSNNQFFFQFYQIFRKQLGQKLRKFQIYQHSFGFQLAEAAPVLWQSCAKPSTKFPHREIVECLFILNLIIFFFSKI